VSGRAMARFAEQVRQHAKAGGCDSPTCALCQARRVWDEHPEWGNFLPAYWWKGGKP
jgi:hypothetical protein